VTVSKNVSNFNVALIFSAVNHELLLADTYVEIMNGRVIDYYCKTDQEVSTGGVSVVMPASSPSCVVMRTVAGPTEFFLTAWVSDNCAAQGTAALFVCDFYP